MKINPTLKQKTCEIDNDFPEATIRTYNIDVKTIKHIRTYPKEKILALDNQWWNSDRKYYPSFTHDGFMYMTAEPGVELHPNTMKANARKALIEFVEELGEN